MNLFNIKRKHSCLHKAEIVNKSNYFILAILICISVTGCNKANENSNKEPENIYTAAVSPTTLANQDTSIGKNTTSDEVQVTEKVIEVKDVDYSDCFNGIEGCAVFFNSNTNTYMMYNKKLCEKRTSPCSTFKIVATLMGLDNGVIASVDTTMGYNGTIYSMDQWNKDLSLKDAFKESCVWYFRKVIDKVGQSNVQSYLDQLKYGNCDLSEWDGSGINSLPELNGFWLESSLEISPKEQVDILANLFSGKTDFSKQNINILKEVMLTQRIGSVSVYGKTGTGQNDKTKHRDNGWFVGMFENSDESYYFAVHLNDDNKEVSGPMAKEIVLDIINWYYTEN